MPHTSHFSMGVDIADINNDGLSDILSLDMLPESLAVYKASGTEYGYTTYQSYLKNGYHPQYMQNALQVNQGNGYFSETAFYSGVASTSWSWAPLIADLDNDGDKDIFITNGIQGATNQMDFVKYISNEHIQKQLHKGMRSEDMALIDQLPDDKVRNYFFENQGNLKFGNRSKQWADQPLSYSHGAVFTDLDKDGDLDLVTNNAETKAFIYENTTKTSTKTDTETNHFVQICLKGDVTNSDAIGSKVTLWYGDKHQTVEVFRTRGYLSSVSPVAHFGLGGYKKLDSVVVRWPKGELSVYTDITLNTQHILEKAKGRTKNHTSTLDDQMTSVSSWVVNDTLPLHYVHKDFTSKDFVMEPLAPYAISNEGPHITVTDVNQDGLVDICVPGGPFIPTQVYHQTKTGSFKLQQIPALEAYKRVEDIAVCFVDTDLDTDLDLIVISGGNEVIKKNKGRPRYYKNNKGIYEHYPSVFDSIDIEGAVIRQTDIDLDGDPDVFIGSNTVARAFGASPHQYLFINDGKGNYSDQTALLAPELQKLGMVYDAQFCDWDQDGDSDLIVAGHFLPITIFINDGQGRLLPQKNNGLQDSHGWWHTIQIADMDIDGDLDIVAGNWGLNTRLQASKDAPIRLYRADFDNNGKIDPILTYIYQGEETPLATKDELTKQMPVLNKTFLSYKAFAEAPVASYFSKERWKKAEVKKVYTLASTYFEQTEDHVLKTHPLPWQAQLSSTHAILIDDVNVDSYPDLIFAGNTHEISTQLGRLDGSYATLLLNDTKGNFRYTSQEDLKIRGAVRSIVPLQLQDQTYYLFGVNKDSLQFAKKIKHTP